MTKRIGTIVATATCVCAVPLAAQTQSVLGSAGDGARTIEGLWWFMLIACAIVYLLVLAFLVPGLRRGVRNRQESSEPIVEPDAVRERRMKLVIGIATASTVVVLFIFVVRDFTTGRELMAPRDTALTIELVGHQFWWEIHYADTIASRRAVTANELHIPVGRNVLVKGTSRDVIHSFWAPNIQGKRDLIPGMVTSLWLRADTPGVYRAQCAEFCGLQHANMALLVIAEPAEKFQAWLDRQLQPAKAPVDSMPRRGQEVFLSSTCVMCHTVSGTHAASIVGPDLTHFASRHSIAAGTRPNTIGHLAGWIVDPQKIKPGCRMPQNSISPDDLHALLAYLRTLE